MQNEFDDHIKKHIDGFKLPPSPQVWDLVEARLPEKKRRRFIYWWLPLGVLLIGFGIYKFSGNDKKNATINDNKITAEIKTDKNDLINDSIKINNSNRIADNQNRNLDKTTAKFLNKITSNKITLNKILKNNNGGNKIELIKKNDENEIGLNNGTYLKNNDKLFNKDSIFNNNVLKELITLDKINPIAEGEIKNNKTIDIKKDNIAIKGNLDSQAIHKLIDSSTIDLAEKKTENIKNDSGLNKSKKVIKTNLAKIKWELIAAVGNANTVGNILSKNSNLQDFSPPNNSATSPGNTLTQASLSAPTAGLSLALNLQRTKQITKKLAWYGSVGYRYLSNHQVSGAFVDSSKIIGGDSLQLLMDNGSRIDKVSNYYKYGNTLNHTNYVHLLNVTLGLKYNLSKAFSLNGGLAFGYQIKTNWLQPDLIQSVLYYSNKLTNKWNVGADIGFNWQFAKPLSLGVFYNYSFSKASLATVQQNLHWQSFGATISIQLPFKK